MNKQEALERLSALEAETKKLREIIEQPEQKSKQERFLELISGVTLKFDKSKYLNSTFGFRGDDFIFEYNSESKCLWLSYYKIWRVFEIEYNLKYDYIQSFIKGVVEEHFKFKGVTPVEFRYGNTFLVEEHFKFKGVTPNTK